MAGNPLSQYGYPSMGQMQAQARGLASAAVPTLRSINAQYGRQQSNVTGFTNALVSALRGDQGAVGQGYNQAIAQQGALDAAAQHALGALGSSYAGAAVANQGLGNSASSRLISQGAAARNYSSQLPGVGAAQGALAHMTLNQGQNQAIQQRNDAFRSALSQAMQQVQSNALARAQAAADISLNNRKLAQAEQQINNQASQFQQNLAQNASQFQQELAAKNAAAAQSAQLTRNEYLARYGFDIYTGKFVKGAGGGPTGDAAVAKRLGITPSELEHQLATSQQEITTRLMAAQSGAKGWQVPSFEESLGAAQQNGVNPQIAQMAALRVYTNALRLGNPYSASQPDRRARWNLVMHWFQERLGQAHGAATTGGHPTGRHP